MVWPWCDEHEHAYNVERLFTSRKVLLVLVQTAGPEMATLTLATAHMQGYPAAANLPCGHSDQAVPCEQVIT